MSNKDFYRAFEDAHRGSRELIKNRVSIYLPFVLPLKDMYSNCPALDIGCGRGEWLELLKDNNISAQGIDFDEGMLKACHQLGLDVMQGDGIKYLKEQESDSKIVISAFHVVEHISFEDLQLFVEESLRVLKPGGLLIMETPNPENLKVASENFYLDPTHIKPIPSKLLSFLPEFYGYARTKVLRLQESQGLVKQENINLLQVIEGVSPDYAVIAQKEASQDILKQFDELFNREFGLSLSTLTEKFENRLLNIEAKASEAEAKASEAEAKASEAEAKASEAEAKASEAEARTNDALHHYHSVINSNSWKIMKPFRILGKLVRWFVYGLYHWLTFSPTSRPRRVIKNLALKIKNYINTRPQLKYKIINILNKFPTLKARLKRIGNTEQSCHATENSKYKIQNLELSHLSPQAKRIYNDLKYAIEQRKNEVQK